MEGEKVAVGVLGMGEMDCKEFLGRWKIEAIFFQLLINLILLRFCPSLRSHFPILSCIQICDHEERRRAFISTNVSLHLLIFYCKLICLLEYGLNINTNSLLRAPFGFDHGVKSPNIHASTISSIVSTRMCMCPWLIPESLRRHTELEVATRR